MAQVAFETWFDAPVGTGDLEMRARIVATIVYDTSEAEGTTPGVQLDYQFVRPADGERAEEVSSVAVADWNAVRAARGLQPV